jgi:hypothetical protein
MTQPTLVIVGAGAAGCFAAIQAKRTAPHAKVILLEASHKTLAKVRISGGGRCNVTHACPDTATLLEGYPRGGKALLSLFNRFNCADTEAWFAAEGVRLHTEADGRRFPTTNDSSTIVNALLTALSRAGVELRTGHRLTGLQPLPQPHATGAKWQVELAKHPPITAHAVCLATGGANPTIGQLLAELGVPWVPQVPSLFTFCVDEPTLDGLAGVSVPHAAVQLVLPPPPAGQKLDKLAKQGYRQTGPVLVTHWGLSGPAILKLSAWGARELAHHDYRLPLLVDWLANTPADEVQATFAQRKQAHPKQALTTEPPDPTLPKRLWYALCEKAQLPPELRWADASKVHLASLLTQLKACPLTITGKGVFKEEFVSAGGVDLKGLSMATLAVKHHAGLHIAGELLNIDGVTGGYNFQSAWASGFVAGTAMAEGL